MKQFILILSASLLGIEQQPLRSEPSTFRMHIPMLAQSPFDQAVARLNSTDTEAGYQELARTFLRLSADGQWLPQYYAAVCHMQLAYLRKDKAMAYADLAEKEAQKAESLLPAGATARERSEVYCLQAFIQRARVEADPRSNGRKYGPISGKLLAKARSLDAANPRATYLDGLIKLRTPAMWGGDKTKAKALLSEAKRQFTAQPANASAPQWGARDCEKILNTL
ncbi:hypothetical protein ACWKWU_13410 [Chitinophaga lutea]